MNAQSKRSKPYDDDSEPGKDPHGKLESYKTARIVGGGEVKETKDGGGPCKGRPARKYRIVF